MPDHSRYYEDVAAARQRALVLAEREAQELMTLLAEFADELGARVRAGLATEHQAEVSRVVNELYARLAVRLQAHVRAAVELTAAEVATALGEALARVAPQEFAAAAPAIFTGVAPRAAQAVLARPEFARAFATIRAEGAADARQIIARGVLRGGQTGAIERQLRMHIGAPGSLLEGDAELLSDRRRIGFQAARDLGMEPTSENVQALRAEAGKIAEKARLVGRQEVMTAEHETHVRTAAANPIILCVEVRVSGRHPVFDICDVATLLNLYGFGPGRYPPEAIPARFHPRCLCRFVHVLRPRAEWHLPRPRRAMVPGVRWAAIAKEHGLSPSELRQLRGAIETAPAAAAA